MSKIDRQIDAKFNRENVFKVRPEKFVAKFGREKFGRENVAKIGPDTVAINFTCSELSEQYQLGTILTGISAGKLLQGTAKKSLQNSAEKILL